MPMNINHSLHSEMLPFWFLNLKSGSTHKLQYIPEEQICYLNG
jgi:hypothetical protein